MNIFWKNGKEAKKLRTEKKMHEEEKKQKVNSFTLYSDVELNLIGERRKKLMDVEQYTLYKRNGSLQSKSSLNWISLSFLVH